MAKPKAIYLLDQSNYDLIYGPTERAELSELLDIIGPLVTRETLSNHAALLAEAEIILSGWGMANMDEAFLAAAPRLKAVFYAAGSIRNFVTEAVWQRDIIICSAYAANAIPVAEYTLGVILLSLKHFWRHAYRVRHGGAWWECDRSVPGAYQSTVGLISLGTIARKTLELLRPFELRTIAYSRSVTPDAARTLGVQLCSLDEVFQRADVVSLHTPCLPTTRGMIRGSHFRLMKPGATFINTARGAVVNEPEMIAVLQERPDLTAVLDVTDPEPPLPGSPLYTLPNVVLTPHIAGSMGNECRRMARYMVEEVRRYCAGQPLQWRITREQAATLA